MAARIIALGAVIITFLIWPEAWIEPREWNLMSLCFYSVLGSWYFNEIFGKKEDK